MTEEISRRSFITMGVALGSFVLVNACTTTKKSNQVSEKEKLKRLRSLNKYSEKKIEIGDSYFEPKETTIEKGTIVIWTNAGNFLHDIIWDEASPANKDQDFSSKPLQSKDIHVHLFEKPGKYYYHCHFHGGPQRGQWGLITVK